MTVVRIVDPKNYVGVSGDSKPSTSAGSTFYETDTRLVYVYDGSAWQLRLREES